MTDSTLNRFLAYGTNAQRLAFTPSVPTPASGPSQAYWWYETDTGSTYAYSGGAWHITSSASGNVSGPGSSTDRAITTWNGTGGTVLRDNSAVTIDASGNITTSGKIAATGNVTGGNLTTAGLISATGNISGGNLTTVGLVSATGTIAGSNIGNITSINLNGNGSTVLLGNGTFGAQTGSAFSGAMVKKAGNQTGANYNAGVIVTWDAEAYDVGTWHDTVTNNTRLTVPSGISYAQFGGYVSMANVTSNVFMEIALLKNGVSGFDGAADLTCITPANTPGIGFTSGAVAVTVGDYFEMYLSVADTSMDVLAARSNFWARAVG